ncbi:hypothetical protein [Methanopyrus sp. SNP6]|uniref:hypothetical protein n=1 Tax=Methanopyrus sp. SNP6 TaxID=1937005 RepID=UPI00143A2103|nr:hypothetical protein [Methanopyrus sp. SNP6]
MLTRVLMTSISTILLATPACATDVGVFAWGSTIRSEGVQKFTDDILSTGYTEVAVLIRGVSTPTRVDTLSAVYSHIKARDPNVKVYAWIVGFERKDGWDKPWDPEARREILDAVRSALPYCDGVILDDSFRYPTSDPVKRAKAMQAITDLVREISELVHSHGKVVYFCLLPEKPEPYSIDRDAIATYVDKFIVEAYTEEYGRDDEWPVRVYKLYERLYPGKVAIALHELNESRLAHQLTLLKEAGCPDVWLFRYGEVKRMELVRDVIRSITESASGTSQWGPVGGGQFDLSGLLLTGLVLGTFGGLALSIVNPELLSSLGQAAIGIAEITLELLQGAFEAVSGALSGMGILEKVSGASAEGDLSPVIGILARAALVFVWGLLLATLLSIG